MGRIHIPRGASDVMTVLALEVAAVRILTVNTERRDLVLFSGVAQTDRDRTVFDTGFDGFDSTALPENPDMKRVEEFVMEVNRRSLDG